MGSPLRGIIISRFSTNNTRYISQTMEYSAVVTMEGEYELECDLANGAICNDSERTLTLFLRSHHSDAKYPTNGYRYGHS